jgi:hypothetical protein
MVIADAGRGIEAQPGDIERAKREMRAAGALFTQSRAVRKIPRVMASIYVGPRASVLICDGKLSFQLQVIVA